MLHAFFGLQLKDGFYDQFKQSFAPIELGGKLKEDEYETEDVSVQIVELSTDELAKANHWIGANRPVYDDEAKSSKQNGHKTTNTTAMDDESASEDIEEDDEEEVPGFTVTTTSKPKKLVRKAAISSNGTTTADDPSESDPINPDVPDEKKKQPQTKKQREDFKSKRAMGQFLAKRAQSSLKHSKAFQLKNRLERVRNKKKARIEKEKRIKLQNKREKHKKNSMKKTKTDKKFNRNKKSGRN